MTLSRIFKNILRLPRTLAETLKRRQHQFLLDEREAERLDRIRNPSKYLGK